MSAILLTTDLACSSQVGGTAKLHGWAVKTVMSPSALLQGAAGCELVILDLDCPAIHLASLVPALRSLQPVPQTILAFGPHVHETKLAAAHADGADGVDLVLHGKLPIDLPDEFREIIIDADDALTGAEHETIKDGGSGVLAAALLELLAAAARARVVAPDLRLVAHVGLRPVVDVVVVVVVVAVRTVDVVVIVVVAGHGARSCGMLGG